MLDKITGQVRIFTREVEVAGKKHIFFNTCVGSSKGKDDKYINYYMLTKFNKSINDELKKVCHNDSFDVLIKEAWINAYKDKNGYAQPILFINKGEIVTAEAKPKKKASKLEPIEDDDLPF